MTRRLTAALLLALAATGCAAPPIAAPRPAAALRAQTVAPVVAPALDAARLTVALEGGHHAEIAGAAGAVAGAGVWGSPGDHAAPANGEEATARPDGSFTLELHAHPGERVTLWAFVDRDGKRVYGAPVVLDLPKS